VTARTKVLDFTCTFDVVFYNRGDRRAWLTLQNSGSSFPVLSHSFPSHPPFSHSFHACAFWHID